ncbi:hypothetical protein [Rubrivirga sp.]|uniref:hypothetical protein n=1 Tax=Rubrivirga sp. TaxID=1885344 RepID=UPI003B5259DE
MTAVGGVLGVGSIVGTYFLTPTWYDTPAGAALLVLAYPVGVATGVVFIADSYDMNPPFRDVLVDAVIGVPVGVIVGGLVGVVVGGVGYLATPDVDYNFLPALVGGGVGVLTAVGVSSAFATRRVRVAPSALRAPTGEAVAGLRVTIGL